MQTLELKADYKVAGEGGKLIRMVANTPGVDKEGEIVLPSGCVLDDNGQPRYFGNKRALYYNHDYYSDLPCATLVRADLRNDQWIVTARLHGKNQLSRDLIALMELGDDCPVRACSIGFDPLNSRAPTQEEIENHGPALRRVIDRWEWVELSFTPMPCNPEAMIIDYGEVKKMADAGRISRKTALTLGMNYSANDWQSSDRINLTAPIRLDAPIRL